MKSIEFKVRLTFTNDMRPEHLFQTAQNISIAIKNEETNSGSIAPADTLNELKKVEVSHILIQKVSEKIK